MKKPKLIPDWRSALRFHSVRLAILGSVLNGAIVGLAAFVDRINPWWFLGLNVAGYAAIGVVRLIKQRGL